MTDQSKLTFVTGHTKTVDGAPNDVAAKLGPGGAGTGGFVELMSDGKPLLVKAEHVIHLEPAGSKTMQTV